MRYILSIVMFAITAGFAVPAHAQTDNYPYSIMRPEPGTRQTQPVRKHVAPHRIVKRTEKRKTVRGSSNPVYPARLPAPEKFTPPESKAVINHPPTTPPSMYVPQTGQTLQNLPTISGAGKGGTESFQDRSLRCTHQAGVYGPSATGDRNSYIGGCINQ